VNFEEKEEKVKDFWISVDFLSFEGPKATTHQPRCSNQCLTMSSGWTNDSFTTKFCRLG